MADKCQNEDERKKVMKNDYDDIINMPHHVSQRHPQMSMWNRAAQFAPFAALTGYGEAIQQSEQKNELCYEINLDDDGDSESC